MKQPILALLFLVCLSIFSTAQTPQPQRVIVTHDNSKIGKLDVGIEKKTAISATGQTTEKYRLRPGLQIYQGKDKEVTLGGTYQRSRINPNGKYTPSKAGITTTIRWGPGAGKPRVDNSDGHHGTFCRNKCK